MAMTRIREVFKRRDFALAAFLLIVVVLPILLIWGWSKLKGDPNAVKQPQVSQVDEQSMLEQLQAQTEEESFHLKLNGLPTFDGNGEGDLLLQNPLDNTRSMQVTIALDETGEEVFQSAVLPPGGQVLRAKLSPVPSPGVHEATAEITVIDLKTGEIVGNMEVAMHITIEG